MASFGHDELEAARQAFRVARRQLADAMHKLEHSKQKMEDAKQEVEDAKQEEEAAWQRLELLESYCGTILALEQTIHDIQSGNWVPVKA